MTRAQLIAALDSLHIGENEELEFNVVDRFSNSEACIVGINRRHGSNTPQLRIHLDEHRLTKRRIT